MAWRYLLVVLMLSVAIVSPVIAQDESDEVEETVVPVPTATPQPSPSPVPASPSPVPAPGAVLISDTFDNLDTGVLPRASGNPDRYTRGYENGEYRLSSQTDDSPFAILPGSYENASMAVDARLIGDPEDRLIGLSCRVQAGPRLSGYRLLVEPGDLTLRLTRIDDGNAVALVDWQTRSAIARGSSRNRVELSCAGSVISVLINGVPVATAFDGTYRSGSMMLSALRFTGTLDIDARLDNLMVTQRADESAPPTGPYDGSWTGSNAGGRETSFAVRHNSVVSVKVSFEVATSGVTARSDYECIATGSHTLFPERPAPIQNDSFSLTVSVPVRTTLTTVGETGGVGFDRTDTITLSGRFTSPGSAAGEVEVTTSGVPVCAGRMASPWTARKA